jgi:hypothetical protein
MFDRGQSTDRYHLPSTDIRSAKLIEHGRKMNSGIQSRLLRPFKVMPLATASFVSYAVLPSRFIFPEDYGDTLHESHRHIALFNTADIFLVLTVLISCVWYARPPSGRMLSSFLVLLAAIVTSLIWQANVSAAAVSDGVLTWLRFACVYFYAFELAQSLGAREAEKIIYLIFIGLAASLIFTADLQFDEYRRSFASGMTVGSTAQIASAVALLAFSRSYYWMWLFCIGVLGLTASVTSTCGFIIMTLFIISSNAFASKHGLVGNGNIQRSSLRFGHSLYFIVVIFAIIFASIQIFGSSGYSFSLDSITNLHGRREIWSYGCGLFLGGDVGPFGIGFGRTPEYLNGSLQNFDYMTNEYVHFHSIIFEWIIGLGVLSLPMFCAIFWQIARAVKQRKHRSLAILLFFIGTQAIDYSIYRPKEEILWAFILGVACAECWPRPRLPIQILREARSIRVACQT